MIQNLRSSRFSLGWVLVPIAGLAILAVILFGSLSYDQVWAKSDIDMMLVGPEPKSGAKLLSKLSQPE